MTATLDIGQGTWEMNMERRMKEENKRTWSKDDYTTKE
jgi:hypothetical protein